MSEKRITVSIPASSSNLGPGFDCVALALSLRCNITFELAQGNGKAKASDAPMVTFAGNIAKTSRPQDLGNLIYKILSELWSEDKALLNSLRIHVDSEIPLGCGLGSSAAALVGALWADHVFKDRIPTTGNLLQKAGELEGHNESVAASLLGGCVVTAPSEFQKTIVARLIKWPSSWKTIVVIPNRRMQTKDARAVLPTKVSFEDGVWNAQRSALLVAAIASCDEATYREAVHDRLHEPYREALVPELASLRRALVNAPYLSCTLSGGGPALLVVVKEKHKATVMEVLQDWAKANKDKPKVLEIAVDEQGIQEMIG